jgi:hypothetical protein
MTNHIGYTSEKFRVTGESIYKYTENPVRKEFLQSQMNHLLAISQVLPENTPHSIIWVENEKEWGYRMEYIADASRVSDAQIVKVFDAMISCSKIYPSDSIPGIDTFLDYLTDVLEKNSHAYTKDDLRIVKTRYLNKLLENKKELDSRKSSSHGDFTMENILVSADRLVLIDCIKKDGMWTSWLLDAAKFYQNIYFKDTPKTFSFSRVLLDKMGSSSVIGHLIFLLMISNYIRMFPYIEAQPEIFKARYSEFQMLIEQL